ncbi:MAG: hypothetical protein IKK26_05870 [Clostridia bacterium]|nr:hypothetical protein [Clostridia bacterium]MBR6651118.1 hypothetical protein [Clostridia bacterium]
MKKKTPDEKLQSAISVIADIISSEATTMKRYDERDIKQLKDLTGAAKELAAVIKTLEKDETTPNTNETKISISFEEEGDKWAT